MRRRNLIIASDSDEEGDAASTPSTSVSVASGGGGSGNVGRPSPQNPTPPPGSFYQPPSSPPPSPPVEISDDDDEFFDEIQDPDDDPFFVDIPDDLPAPPPPPTHPAPTTPTLTPTSAPPRPPPSTRTPTPTPPSAPAPPAWARTPTPTPPSARTPTPTPLSARTPTPTPPPAPAPARSPIQSPLPIPAFAPPPPARSPFPTPPSARAPTPTPPSVRTPTSAPPSARTPTSTPLAASTPPSALNPRLRAVYGFLQAFGLRVRPEWLESCAAGLPGFDALGGTEAQARRCFEQFLFADMNACGAGVLPEGVGCMDAAVLNGPFVLQVDEIVNISAPLRERYRDAHAGPKRCLKLSMTDGIQRVYGMEYRPIKDLTVLASAGFKVIIRNVHIRRGLLMLVPEVIEILLGVVDELEAARDRLVTEVNKPPRGKRKQGGLPLSSRAMLAAWASNINTTNGGEQGMSMPRTINSSLPTGLDNASQVCRTTQTTVGGHVNPSVAVNGVQEQSQHVQEFTVHSLSTSLTRNNTEAPPPATYRYDSQQSIRKTSQTMMEEHVDLPTMANSVHEQIQRVQEITMQDRTTAFTRNSEPSASTPCGYESPQQQRPHGMGDTDSVVEAPRSSYADNEVDQIEYPVILSGENEKPFTYIVNISNDQDTRSYIQGKIKGLITSVKHFNFKGCKEYELYIYIDDGSNISEAFVDHNNIIGHSPEEVRVALYSDPKSATSSAMKETMKRFQSFLMKFEGTMFIEFNKNSPVPIVREMNEGCLSSDAWLLLRRTKAFSAPRHMRSLDFMDTTP